MRSKLFLILLVAGCYKAGGPETCEPVVSSWGAPITHCTPVIAAAPAPAPAPVVQPAEPPPPPPPAKTEVTKDEIKLKERVEFQTDSAVLLPTSTPILDEVVKVMSEHPELEHVRVGGHTDSTSTPEHNMKLSEQRAASVKQYLIDHGIAADRLVSKGYGQTRPIADNATEEGRAQNRRVEIHVLRHKGESEDHDPTAK